jgi:acyl-coenzyme A synthetase/AMP-(fatty) acid ligase
MPNSELYLVDDDGRPIEGAGEGELVVRGSNVMPGYWRQPETTARTFRDGPVPGEKVLFTGDTFRRDEDGFYYFVGRRDEMIKSRGERVSPREIENVLCELPEVAEAAVIGVPDPILGQSIRAYLVLRGDAALADRAVLRHCAVRLEDFAVPQRVFFRDALPLGNTGKIDKKALLAEALAEEAAA